MFISIFCVVFSFLFCLQTRLKLGPCNSKQKNRTQFNVGPHSQPSAQEDEQADKGWVFYLMNRKWSFYGQLCKDTPLKTCTFWNIFDTYIPVYISYITQLCIYLSPWNWGNRTSIPRVLIFFKSSGGSFFQKKTHSLGREKKDLTGLLIEIFMRGHDKHSILSFF